MSRILKISNLTSEEPTLKVELQSLKPSKPPECDFSESDIFDAGSYILSVQDHAERDRGLAQSVQVPL